MKKGVAGPRDAGGSKEQKKTRGGFADQRVRPRGATIFLGGELDWEWNAAGEHVAVSWKEFFFGKITVVRCFALFVFGSVFRS